MNEIIPPPPLKKYLEFNIIVIMYHNLPKYWNSLIWVIYKSLLKLHIKNILGLCLGETLPIKIWNAKYYENYLELVLTKNSNHSWIIWKFFFVFYSLSPCISDCRKIRAALSVFGIEMGVRGPSPVLVSYNRSLGGQAPRNAGSLLNFLQTPAPSATNLLKNKFMWKCSFAFCV